MQNTAANNEEFLNMVANLVGALSEKVDDLKDALHSLEASFNSLHAKYEDKCND